MGQGNSKEGIESISGNIGKTEAEIVNLMMPIYFVVDEVSHDDLERAKEVWNMILNDTAPGYLTLKGTKGFSYASCIMMFYDAFYSRLFDVHPMARPMFKSGLKSQGKFLVKMISLSLSLVDDPGKFQVTLVKLTDVHNKRGVKAIEYGIVGEVLFWTLRKCLGRDYDARTHGSYVKVFSRMLKVMVPVAVAFEMNNSEAQQERLSSAPVSRANSQNSRANSSEHQSEAGSEASSKDSSMIDRRYG